MVGATSEVEGSPVPKTAFLDATHRNHSQPIHAAKTFTGWHHFPPTPQTDESLEKKSRAVTGQASVNEAKLFREQWGSVRECRIATGHSPLLLYKTQSGL